jgi:hypothetical protein
LDRPNDCFIAIRLCAGLAAQPIEQGYIDQMPLSDCTRRITDIQTGAKSATRAVAVILATLLSLAAITAVARADDAASPPRAKPSAAEMAEYERALAEYNKAWGAYSLQIGSYWALIAQKKQLRVSKRQRGQAVSLDDYVLNQPPPPYSGPPKPINPAAPKPPEVSPPYVPVVADFLRSAASEFNFKPSSPRTEIDFKKAYAQLAAAAGLTKDQVVRIYAFEATGNGRYDTQAGLEYQKPGAHAITTALGYNQLLATNSVELLAEKGDLFVSALNNRATQLPENEGQGLRAKAAVLQTMVQFASSVPDDWGQHKILASSPKGLGVHALNLDVDVGPLLQTQKLLDSVLFARKHGYAETLTAAELEMMNLSGDGNGFDMLVMPKPWRDQVPTANFFEQSGYEDNTVVQKNSVVSKLIAATDRRMDDESKKQGAKELVNVFPNNN